MLFKASFVLLAIWLLGLVGVYRLGDLVHVFLLVGLMLLLRRCSRRATQRCGRPTRRLRTNG